MTAIGMKTSRVRMARLGRVDARMLIGVLLVAVSVVGGLVVWGAARETAPVLVIARDLPASHVLRDDDLAEAQVKLEGPQAALAVPATERGQVVGRTLRGAAHAGELLVRPELATGPVLGPEDVAVTVPVRADSLYGRLRPGDAVAVLVTQEKEKPNSRTTTILERVTVYAVSLKPGSTMGSARSGEEDAGRAISNVTLVLSRSQAEAVAHAAINADITLALLSPAAKGP